MYNILLDIETFYAHKSQIMYSSECVYGYKALFESYVYTVFNVINPFARETAPCVLRYQFDGGSVRGSDSDLRIFPIRQSEERERFISDHERGLSAKKRRAIGIRGGGKSAVFIGSRERGGGEEGKSGVGAKRREWNERERERKREKGRKKKPTEWIAGSYIFGGGRASSGKKGNFLIRPN